MYCLGNVQGELTGVKWKKWYLILKMQFSQNSALKREKNKRIFYKTFREIFKV